MHFEIFGHNLVEDPQVKTLPITIVVDGCGSSMCGIHNKRIFHPHPGCYHATKRAPEHNNRTVLAVGFLDEPEKFDIVHHGLVCSQVNEILFQVGSFLITEWHAHSEVAVFRVQEESLKLFGNEVIVPTCVFVEHFNGALITTIHQNGTSRIFVPVSVVH